MNVRKIITIGFIIFCSLTRAECSDSFQKVIILTSGNTDTDKALARNVKFTFKTVKVNFTCVDAASYKLEEELNKLDKENDLLVIAVANLSAISMKTKIIEFVKSGGKVFFTSLGLGSESLLNMAGVKKYEKKLDLSTFKPVLNIFPGLDIPETATSIFRPEGIKVELFKNAQVIIKKDNGSPVVWKYPFEKGTVLVFNSNLTLEPLASGLIIQLASMVNSYFLTTVFNAKVVFIDDFPCPFPIGSEYIITSKYDGRSYEEFYKDIWWPQLKELAKKYDIKYTCLVLANYANSTKLPPVKLSRQVVENIKYYGKDLIKNGHEMGIHGYNHASLLTDKYKKELKEIGYQPWKSTADMEIYLEALKKLLDEKLGKIDYYTYVPPMNMISKKGKKAVIDVFPKIKCIAALGDPYVNEPGVLHQEIGPDPDFPQIYGLPRFSSGYLYSNNEMWLVYSYIAFCGLFSHFIHPDDLMDSERSGNQDWKGLHDGLKEIFKDIYTKFPFLRAMTSREFVEERFKTMNMKVYSHREGNEIRIKYTVGNTPLFHYLRLNNKQQIVNIKNGKFQQIGNIEGLYLIKGLKSPVVVTVK